MMTNDPSTIDDWINAIDNYGTGLTKWEQDFFDSVADQWAEKKWISDKQEAILERIYANKTGIK